MLNSKSIGNKIVEARKKFNLSQAELAEQVLISPQAIGKWERGESMPDIITLNRLAEIFEVDLNYFSDSFQPYETATATNEKNDKQIIEIPTPKEKKIFSGNWDMSKGNWANADFSGLKNLKDKFSASNMKNCKFLGADLSGLFLNSNNIENCDFSGSDMRNSKIQRSNLSRSVFMECSLIGSEFANSEISDCNFTNANFNGSEFVTSEFRNNKIEKAKWKLTSFKTSYLVNIIFDGIIEDCIFEYCSFSRVAFENTTLRNTFFKCKTLKHLKFTDCQADRITYEFLKNGKANLTGITLLS
jgi:uncharacterized protein YjbI with pentapeptide repeats